MDRGDDKARAKLVEAALANKGQVPLADLLIALVPLDRLRDVARARGIAPKGFRVDTAPAPALAAALTRELDAELVAELCEVLAETRVRQVPAPTPGSASAAASEQQAALERAQALLVRANEAQQREALRLAECERQLGAERERIALLRGQVAALEQRAAAHGPATPDRDLARELHGARVELDALARVEDEFRRRVAQQQTELRAAQARIEELETKVPQGRKRRPPPPPPPERFRVPYLGADFYRSLEGRDRRSVEAVFDAIFRLASEGLAYPGLQAKQLEGIDLWSMRAGIKVRVYFRVRADGDVDVLEVADREDQPTLLRRLR